MGVKPRMFSESAAAVVSVFAGGLGSGLLPVPLHFSPSGRSAQSWMSSLQWGWRQKGGEEVSERLHASHLPLLFSLIKMHLLRLLAPRLLCAFINISLMKWSEAEIRHSPENITLLAFPSSLQNRKHWPEALSLLSLTVSQKHWRWIWSVTDYLSGLPKHKPSLLNKRTIFHPCTSNRESTVRPLRCSRAAPASLSLAAMMLINCQRVALCNWVCALFNKERLDS